MRAMIVAAGLGTRLRPLTLWRPKPTLPVRGVPLIAYQLELLSRHGVGEVVINAHHLPDAIEATARAECPPGMTIHISREPLLLDTGGAIRRVASFLAESEPSLVLGGDMLLDVDLTHLVERHRERGDAVTLLLREDPRTDSFGSVGVDAEGRVCRIGSRFPLETGSAGPEARAGIYTWANVVSRRALGTLPDREVFSHFDDWLAPLLAEGARDIRGEFLTPCLWEPVGTLEEYLAVQWQSRRLSYLDVEARARRAGTRIDGDRILGAGATLGAGARLSRVVVWDGENVPAGLRAHDGVFAGGIFHPAHAGANGVAQV